MKMRIAKNNQSGQGLLEAIVALGIIIGGIVGIMNLTLSNQSSSEEAAARLIATNLAREGIELARNKRDSNWLARAVWDEGLENGIDYTAALDFNASTNTWVFDFAVNDINDDNARVWRDNNVYFQTQGVPASGKLTNYRRLLKLDEICQDKSVPAGSCPPQNPKIGVKAQAIVSWIHKNKNNSLILQETMFNWR